MATRTVALDLIEKYSTFSGDRNYFLDPHQVSQSSRYVGVFWSEQQNAMLDVLIQGSIDRVTWTTIDSITNPTSGSEDAVSIALTWPWLRIVLAMTPLGGDPTVTCYFVGFLVLRKRANRLL